MSSCSLSVVKRVVLSVAVAVATASLVGCGEPVEKMLVEESAPAEVSAPQPDVAELIAQARARHSEAQALSHAWSTTQPMIEQASAALQAGEEARARELAERALAIADASVAQAHAEVTAWKARVPK